MKRIISLVLAFLCMFSLVSCVKKSEDNINDNKEEVIDVFVIENKYVNLKLPTETEEKMIISTMENGAEMEIDFSYRHKDEEVEVYSVLFGSEEGVPIGVLSTENGMKIDVSIIVSDIFFDEAWTDQEKDEVYGIQETVNFLIAELTKEECFERN